MNLNETLLTAVLFSMCVGGYCSCPSKPKSCPSDQITFHLFNRSNPNGIQLTADNDKDTNDVQKFTNEQIKLIFHGFGDGINTHNEKMGQLREAYLKTAKYSNINIIQVNYKNLAQIGCFWTLILSLNIIGKCAAEFIKNKIINKGIAIDRIHPIGFGFGAHAAAVTSEKISEAGTFSRLTGIDPALPAFTFPFPGSWHKLNRKHAKFVDVLHTNSGMKGVYSSNAHYDIYGNSGMQQTGCGLTEMLFSHNRALEYYIESVISDIGFHAVKCGRLSIFFGRCKFEPSSKSKVIMVGEPCSPPENKSDEGSYYFPTRPNFPYAVGSPQPKPTAKQP